MQIICKEIFHKDFNDPQNYEYQKDNLVVLLVDKFKEFKISQNQSYENVIDEQRNNTGSNLSNVGDFQRQNNIPAINQFPSRIYSTQEILMQQTQQTQQTLYTQQTSSTTITANTTRFKAISQQIDQKFFKNNNK